MSSVADHGGSDAAGTPLHALVAGLVDAQLASRPDAPHLTSGERLAAISALEGAVEAVLPIVKDMAAQRDRLRDLLREAHDNIAGRFGSDATKLLARMKEALDA